MMAATGWVSETGCAAGGRVGCLPPHAALISAISFFTPAWPLYWLASCWTCATYQPAWLYAKIAAGQSPGAPLAVQVARCRVDRVLGVVGVRLAARV